VGLYYDEPIISNMLASMKHRGPDGHGWIHSDEACLLHTRLAIIDPEGGAQPMHLCFGDKTYTIVYNGELYNTQEIKTQLLRLNHEFINRSDTEVVLHAFAQWGEDCLNRLNGIFAFAVYEHKSKILFLARDKMGVKPLFYTVCNGGIIFASEIKTILQHPAIPAELDRTGVGEILLLGPGRTPGSGVLKNISEVKPGHYAYFDQKKLNCRQYWKLQDREHTENFEQTAEHVRYLVTDAIQRQMVSDVPIGTFLSGGLDSSLISSVCAKVLKENNQSLTTFSVDYENNAYYFVPGKFQPNSDNEYIEIMHQYLDSDHHWTVLKPQQLVDALIPATQARDLPGMADVDFSLLAFCGDIKKKVKVALSGECADEIFGGYPWFRDPDVKYMDGFPWAQNTKQRADFLAPEYAHRINAQEFVMDRYRHTVDECDILPGTTRQERHQKQMVNLNMQWFMQTLLDRKDRMSMHHGLEVRVPFCDYRIAEYLYAVPWKYKEYNGREKGLLRYAMRDYLPHDVLYRKKSPYPKTYDPLYCKLVSQKLEEILQDVREPIFQIVNSKSLKDLLHYENDWPWYGQLMKGPQTIAYMLQINNWLKEYRIQLV
jgi:asparagine synthase (glutamine-hydrolysing)